MRIGWASSKKLVNLKWTASGLLLTSWSNIFASEKPPGE